MRRKEHSRSPDRGDAKRRRLQTETTELDMQSAIAQHVLELKNRCLEDEPPENYVPPLGKETLDASDVSTFPLMPVAMDFLQGERQVMLLMGDAGSGKTHFMRQLERELWAKWNDSDDPIPILFDLSDIGNATIDLLGQVLKAKGFEKYQIRHIKNNDRLITLLCDGYDEVQVQRNIYNCNKFNKPRQGRVKLIIACRSYKIGHDSAGQFKPQPTDKYDQNDLDLFQQAAMAPFTHSMVKYYVQQYVAMQLRLHVRSSSGGTQEAVQPHSSEDLPWPDVHLVWSVQDYMETLTDIPNLMELVENPFILSVVLKLLTSIFGSVVDVARPSIPLDALYQYILDCWIQVSKRRLRSRPMTEDENLAFEVLIQHGFKDLCMEYMRTLVVEHFKKHKSSSARFTLSNAAEWGARWLGIDARARLLQESVPLSRSGAMYRFICPPLLEYVYSLVVFDPNDLGKGDTDTGGFNTENSDSDNAEEIPEVMPSTLASGRAFDKDHPLSFINIANLSTLVQLLADRVQNSQVFKQQLVETVRESGINSSDTDQTLAANAMTILVRSGMQFNSANLRRVKIKGANLTGGEFDSADLRDSDLTGTIFDKCWLRQAVFQGAQLKGAQFGEKIVDLHYVPMTSAYSLDGRLYAVGSTNGYITVFDTTDCKSVYTHQESKKSITALAFAPKGELLSFGDRTGKLRTWSYTSNTLSVSFDGHNDCINGLVYSKDGSRIATACQDGIVGVWDAAKGGRIKAMKERIEGTSSVAFSPDGAQLVSGGSDNMLRLWDVEAGVLVSSWKGHDGAISNVLFSPDGLNLASSSSDKTIRTWSASAGTWGLEMIFRGHTERVTSIAYSPDGQHLASCSDDNTIRTWDSRLGSPGPIFRGHTDRVVSVAYSKDGTQLASCDRDKTFRVWDCRAAVKGAVIFGRTNSISSGMYPYSTVKRTTTDNDEAFRSTRPRPLACNFRSASFGTDVTSFVISPDGFLAASASFINNSHTVIVSYVTTNLHRHFLIGHRKKISSLTFSPDSQRIVSGDFGGVLRVWNAESGESIWTQEEHDGKITSIAYTSTGHQVVSVSEDGTVRLWNALTGDMVHIFDADGAVQCVCFSQCGSWIASGGEDGVVRLWDPKNVVPGAVFDGGHDGTVNSVAFSPDNVHVASAGADSTVRIWNINTKMMVHVLKGHINPVRCLTYSPSGKHIASGSDDSTLKIWDVGSGVPETTWEHGKGVITVLYSLDGAQLLTGTKDYRIYSWIYAFGCQDTAVISTTAISMGGQHVASSLGGNAVQLWDTESGELGPNLYGHTGAVDSVSFSPVGDFIATASSDSTVRIWETAKGGCLEKLEGHTGIVTSVVFSPQGTQVATSGFDQTLRWWDFSIPVSDISSKESDRLGASLHEESGTLDGIYVHDESGLFHAPVYSPDGKEISVISGQHGVLRFDTQTKTAHPALFDRSTMATCIAYSPPGDRIATSNEDGTVRIWDPETGKELLKLVGHRGSVTSVAFSPFSYQLATNSTDATIRLWNVPVNATHDDIVTRELTGHAGPVLCVAYSPDGKFLASGSEDRTMRLWDPFSGACLAKVGDFVVGVKTIQWSESARGGLVLVTGCKENPLQVWELVQAKSQNDRSYQIRKYWGARSEALAVSDIDLGQKHGLGEAERTQLEQRGAIIVATVA